jgi:hypothetical protein
MIESLVISTSNIVLRMDNEDNLLSHEYFCLLVFLFVLFNTKEREEKKREDQQTRTTMNMDVVHID